MFQKDLKHLPIHFQFDFISSQLNLSWKVLNLSGEIFEDAVFADAVFEAELLPEL